MRNQGFTERRPGIGGRKLAVDILPEDRMVCTPFPFSQFFFVSF